jgi:hypothetical protein
MRAYTFITYTYLFSACHLSFPTMAGPTKFMGTTESNSQCMFSDGVGPIDCGYFSVIMQSDGQLTISSSTYKQTFHTSCADPSGNTLEVIQSQLPWNLEIHPGDICNPSRDIFKTDFDRLVSRFKLRGRTFSNGI